MKIKYSKQFLMDVANLNTQQTQRLKQRINLFRRQPSHPTLRNHSLKGKLKGYCSINITGDIRAIYIIERNLKKDDVVQFVRLGTHSQLY